MPMILSLSAMITERQSSHFEVVKRQSENGTDSGHASIAGGSPPPPASLARGGPRDPLSLKERSDEIENKRCNYHSQMYRGRAEKEQESWRQKVSSRLFKILIASQLIQLILLTILLRWLR